MASEFFKDSSRNSGSSWLCLNSELFETYLKKQRWFPRIEFSALIDFAMSRPVKSRGCTQLFTLSPVCSARARARSLRKLKTGMSALLFTYFWKRISYQRKEYILLVPKSEVDKIKDRMSVSKVPWSVCEEFANFDREILDFASSNQVSLSKEKICLRL